MTASFDRAFEFTVMSQEGGFVLSTLKGEKSETYAGIYRHMQPSWPGWVLIDRGDAGSSYIHELVKTFYQTRFWDRLRLDQLPPRLAALVFDFAVNSGNAVAVKKLQQVLMVLDDGEIGPKTVLAASKGVQLQIAIRYLAKRLDYINDLSAWKDFGKGWSQRIVNLMNHCSE